LAEEGLHLDLCHGDTFELHGHQFHEGKKEGTILLPGASFQGCDSLISVDVNYFPQAINNVNASICSSDSFLIQGQVFNSERDKGQIILEGATQYGCDSVITVEVDIRPETFYLISDTLCPGESVNINGQIFNETRRKGEILMPLSNAHGCDSTIMIDLYYTDNYLGLIDSVHLNYGDSITLIPEYWHAFKIWDWESETTLSCLDCERPTAGPLVNTIYRLRATDYHGCIYFADIEVIVNIIRRVFAPNAITVNGDGLNDGFIIFGNYMAERIERLEIYDRWGELVWFDDDLPFNMEDSGWDGRFNGKNVLPGTYVFKADILYKDGQREQLVGDVTVLR
jgi:gliding motility-associated-like protein